MIEHPPDKPMAPFRTIVAELDALVLACIGGCSVFVLLSEETAAKQAERHTYVLPSDYARLQSLIDQGQVTLEEPRTLVFMAELGRGKWWKAVVKCTADGRETLLVTFHRAKPDQVAAARRRGTLIRLGQREAAPGGAQSLLAQPEPRV